MEFNYYKTKKPILNENVVSKIISDIIKTPERFKKTMKDAFNKLTQVIQDNGLEKPFLQIINKNTKMKISSLKQLQSLKESEQLDEDFKNFMRFWKGETYPALSIFPTLQIWFQVDKLIDGAGIMDLDWKKISIYAVMWILIITGQHIILHKKWKKENPDEYKAEGEPGIFRRGKKSTNIDNVGH
jgi:hypothetical protein